MTSDIIPMTVNKECNSSLVQSGRVLRENLFLAEGSITVQQSVIRHFLPFSLSSRQKYVKAGDFGGIREKDAVGHSHFHSLFSFHLCCSWV